MSKNKIGNDFWFNSKRNYSIKSVNEGLKLYTENLERIEKLKGDETIFLDTNILLDYYQISFTERKKLIEVINKLKKRIILTSCVEEEFLRNRVSKIKKFKHQLEETLQKKFNNVKKNIEDIESGNIKGMDEYLESKFIANDYKDIYESINSTYEDYKKHIISTVPDMLEKIKKHDSQISEILKEAIEDNRNMEKNDPLLHTLNDIEVLEALSSEEISFLSSKYKEMQEKYDEFKGDSKDYWKYAFPSCGEEKGKENPMSDFIIFHEILKYSKDNSKNVLFITNDFRKKDWFNTEDFEQYTHYVEKIYSNTSQMIFILKGKNVLNISYEKVFEIIDVEELRKRIISNSEQRAEKIEQKIKLNDLEIDFLLKIANERHSPYGGVDFDNIKNLLIEQGYQKVPIDIVYNKLKQKSLISGVVNEYGDYWGYNLSDKGEKWLESYYSERHFTNKEDDLPF